MHLKQDHPSRKRFFSSNPYKIEVIITSLTEILELPNFGFSGFLALHISEQSPKKLILNRVKGRNASATALRWFASDTTHLCAPLYSICGGSTHLYVFMARSRVCKSLLMAELCLHRFVKLYIYIRSICRQHLFCSLRAHQYSSDQKKTLKDQSAQATARVVSVAYFLWLLFWINNQQIAQLNRVKECNIRLICHWY